jgi:hypothetical protein
VDDWEISITFNLHGIRTTALSSVLVKTMDDGTVALTLTWSNDLSLRSHKTGTLRINGTMSRTRVTIVAVEKQLVL